MLPVVSGTAATTRAVLAYSVLLLATTLLPAALGTFGVLYLVAAGVLGAVFLALAWRLWRSSSPARASALFHYSLLYLALLFAAVALDAAVG
jgi:protoheme IX farnesyltransferase